MPEQRSMFTLTRQPAGAFITDRRLYETKDGRLVEEDDPQAYMLVAAVGGLIDAKTAARLKLTEGLNYASPQPPKAQEPVSSSVAAEPAPVQSAASEPEAGKSAVGKHGSMAITKADQK